jgi:hypothetical protein
MFVIALIGAFHAHLTRGVGPRGTASLGQPAVADASNEFTGHHRDILGG